MASVRKLRNRYQIRWTQPDGEPDSKGGFRTKAAAEATRREIEDCVAGGRRWEPRDVRALVDLRQVAFAYLDDCKVKRKAERTIVSYGQVLGTFLAWLSVEKPALPLAALTRPTLMKFYAHLCTTNAKAGKKTLDRKRAESTPVKRLLELGRWWKWAYDNDEAWPELIPRPRPLGLTMPADKRVKAPTWAECDACIAALTGSQRKAAIIMRFTGLRISQVMRLRWDDVDLDAGVLVVRPELGKTRQEKVGREVPISPHLVALLAGWGVRSGWVIPTFREPGPREREFRSRDMRRAWERAGVRPEVWKGRPDHAYRKAFRTELKRAGGDAEAIEYLMGHEIGEGEEGTYQDPDGLPLVETAALVKPLGMPKDRPGDPKMDQSWIKAIANATDPADKARLRAIPRALGFAEGGTVTRLRMVVGGTSIGSGDTE